MPTFTVTWELDVEADTPEDAARIARDYQRQNGLIHTVIHGVDLIRARLPDRLGVFTVYDERGDGTQVDLDELDVEEANAS